MPPTAQLPPVPDVELDDSSEVVHLRAGATSVVCALAPTTFPWVVHWGPDLGEIDDHGLAALVRAVMPPVGDSLVYSLPEVSVLPELACGWLGRPGLTGSREGRAWAIRCDAVIHQIEVAGSPAWPAGPNGAVRLRSVGTDANGALEVASELELHPSGVVRLLASVRNMGADAYEVQALLPALPVPSTADELLDMAGRHTVERTPQRKPFDMGEWLREARGGRPGHDSATLLCAGETGFDFATGRVWGVHLAYSGNQLVAAERTFNGWRVLRGGELLMAGEVRLGPGERYDSPALVASWGDGLDALSGRLHRYVRDRTQHPRTPRPVLLNTWEAVYFDHQIERLTALAEHAARVGVERFVLDDGWFRGRRDDSRGLGDWYVDENLWPDGLSPLVDRVRELGMEFGLWFEPEMINLDSDLARTHPEWIFDAGHGVGLPSRHQHVLDLGHPEAYAFVLDRISELVDRYAIAYLKWDHNRPLLDAGHAPTGAPGIRQHTLALYRMLDALKRRHPGLEIESCCGGGGRIDLGILERTDRVWASDCIDPHQRHGIQRWTSLLLPPELVGTHIGTAEDHCSDRHYALDFRAGTALWGHLGLELDLTSLTEAELGDVAAWVALHKQLRPLLHSGRVVHRDPANPALRLEGVVADDAGEAVYVLKCLEYPLTVPLGVFTLPGLDPAATYAITVEQPTVHRPDQGRPPWMAAPIELPGRVLDAVGLQAPYLRPDRLIIVRATRVSEADR